MLVLNSRTSIVVAAALIERQRDGHQLGALIRTQNRNASKPPLISSYLRPVR